MDSRKNRLPASAASPSAYRLWSEFDRYQTHMNTLMNEMFGRPFPGVPEFSAGLPQARTIPLNLYKDEGHLVVEAAMPGIDKQNVHVEATHDSLTISGETRLEEEKGSQENYHREIFSGSYHRSIRLPAQVDPGQITAQMQDGVLKVRLPLTRPQPPGGRRIDVE